VSKPLIIVESPTKVRTIQKYVGQEYNVAATVGHIKDLPDREMGIDIENGFTPRYGIIPGKQKVIAALKKAAADADEVFLAPDPDREGEAIAWHTAEVLQKKNRRFHRVLFHELTRSAIQQAMAAPQQLDRAKYEAQQARRILDRIVGYEISPLLWRKVKGGLSAGRVQSVAVRIICERERAIQAFEAEEYWSVSAHLRAVEPPAFVAKLVKRDGKKIALANEQQAGEAVAALAGLPFRVEKVVRKSVTRQPQPPFITSKLQQEAIRKLHFSAKKAMTIAQQLYEGIELGPGEPEGLITYMRTDSTRISAEAAADAQRLIRDQFGPQFSLERPRQFKNAKQAQDAHEAIRPTSVFNTPDTLAPYLNAEQLALYRLIWTRFVASQMTPAIINQVLASISAGAFVFNASGSTVAFPGFMSLYRSADDENDGGGDKEQLPPLTEGMRLELEKLDPKQHFTQPPPRFSEASLVKELEENGIGRPSTYAAILSTIRDKGYVEMVKGYFRPSELGVIVNDLLVGSFPELLDVEFTAHLENDLDRIESIDSKALDILTRFYDAFKLKLEAARTGMQSMKAVGLPTTLPCPQCGRALHIKMGKNGHFLACQGYPECRFSTDYSRDERGRLQFNAPAAPAPTDQRCERCGQPMLQRRGRYGDFLACSGYPQCKHTVSVASPTESHANACGVACPLPGCSGQIVEKRSKRGKIFYGCNRYPECDYAIWDKPVADVCPQCGAPFLVEKLTRREGAVRVCLRQGCGFRQKAG
jgi:DNA topoisomerase-1